MTEYRYGRKRSGIRYQLVSKIEAWLDSIKDPHVQSVARDNVICTGGAITSMLLGEKVNDYDLYFRNLEATLVVAKYYCDQFNSSNKLESCNGYKPEAILKSDRVKIHMQSAGVAAVGQGDYDYTEFSQDSTAEFIYTLCKEEIKHAKAKKPKKYRPVFLTDNAITLSDGVQIVCRFAGKPKELHKNYDFVHATCSWDHANNKLKLPAAALEAMLARNLFYQGSLYPVASIFRMKKFLKRGWRINAGQQLKIMMQISALDLHNIHTLQDQLLGVDVAYMCELLMALKDVDFTKVDGTYVAGIIDQIFESGEPIKGEGFEDFTD